MRAELAPMEARNFSTFQQAGCQSPPAGTVLVAKHDINDTATGHLAVRAGMAITVLHTGDESGSESGWAYCQVESGAVGWLSLGSLASIQSPALDVNCPSFRSNPRQEVGPVSLAIKHDHTTNMKVRGFPNEGSQQLEDLYEELRFQGDDLGTLQTDMQDVKSSVDDIAASQELTARDVVLLRDDVNACKGVSRHLARSIVDALRSSQDLVEVIEVCTRKCGFPKLTAQGEEIFARSRATLRAKCWTFGERVWF